MRSLPRARVHCARRHRRLLLHARGRSEFLGIRKASLLFLRIGRVFLSCHLRVFHLPLLTVKLWEVALRRYLLLLSGELLGNSLLSLLSRQLLWLLRLFHLLLRRRHQWHLTLSFVRGLRSRRTGKLLVLILRGLRLRHWL